MTDIKAQVVKDANETECLRFTIGGDIEDVPLTATGGVNALKHVFERILCVLVEDEAKIKLCDREVGTTAMYHDVAREYIDLLNEDLVAVRAEMVGKGIAKEKPVQ